MAESWGFHVRGGETLKAYPQIGRVIHINQVHLLHSDDEELEKKTGLVRVKLVVGASEFLMASLSPDNLPVVSCKYLFSQPFELSHDWNEGCLYFSGYTDDDVYGVRDNVYAIAVPQVVKVESNVKGNAGKSKSPKKAEHDGEKDSSSDDTNDSDEEDDPKNTGRKMAILKSDAKDSAGNPKSSAKSMVESKMKRPSGSATKAPAAVKKARQEAPQKTDREKSSGHGAKTFKPSKHEGKSLDTCNKPKSKHGVK